MRLSKGRIGACFVAPAVAFVPAGAGVGADCTAARRHGDGGCRAVRLAAPVVGPAAPRHHERAGRHPARRPELADVAAGHADRPHRGDRTAARRGRRVVAAPGQRGRSRRPRRPARRFSRRGRVLAGGRQRAPGTALLPAGAGVGTRGRGRPFPGQPAAGRRSGRAGRRQLAADGSAVVVPPGRRLAGADTVDPLRRLPGRQGTGGARHRAVPACRRRQARRPLGRARTANETAGGVPGRARAAGGPRGQAARAWRSSGDGARAPPGGRRSLPGRRRPTRGGPCLLPRRRHLARRRGVTARRPRRGRRPACGRSR